MDSLSQIVLGAAVAEVALGKKVGNKAAFWGAVIGTIPDLDVFTGSFLNDVDALYFHRGFTHGIVFSLLFAPVLGWIIYKIHIKSGATWKDWTQLTFLSLITHPLLDCFTTWGTQLFWPFSYRVAWNSVFVVDPVYTFPFLVLLVWALFYPKQSKKRRLLNNTGLLVSTLFLLFTLLNQTIMKHHFKAEANRQNIIIKEMEVRPAPLQNILWTANIASDSGYYIGYRSFLDKSNGIDFVYFPKNEHLLQPYLSDKDLQKLLFITKGWFIVEQLAEKHFMINDLRFGLVDGITHTRKDFVFAYEIIVNDNGLIVINQKQYKASKELNFSAFKVLWNRMSGI